jgi:uncharacterized membrane-anchored protein
MWIVQLAAVFGLLFMTTVGAAADEKEAKGVSLDQFKASLKFQTGSVSLPGGIAAINLSDEFTYLNSSDSERVLVDLWGNPPGAAPLGMIFPKNADITSRDTWAVVITYDEDGHVSDKDADGINYDDLVKEMKESNKAANAERAKEGYPALTLVGWAEKPRYDKLSHKLYWAKELNSAEATENTLNYSIRVLGRRGVLVLNAVAGMKEMGRIAPEMQKILAFTTFSPGNDYADFNSDTDKTAEYGIAALVAGGVAAKLGLFGKFFALLIAFKKVLIVGGIAVFAGIRKFLGVKKTQV